MTEDDSLIRQQIEYYRARAGEYDDWFQRKGRYFRGNEHRQIWLSEIDEVRENLKLTKPGGKILELACGTGLWTELLASVADSVVAVDSSPEAIDLNRRRNLGKNIKFIKADLFNWTPNEKYDYVFFGFWLSHVPRSFFDNFWSMISNTLLENGQVFFVDSLFNQESTATDHDKLSKDGRAKRKLNDGREFEIIKEFYEPLQLEITLKDRDWYGYVRSTKNFFLYGNLRKASGKGR